jgi:cytochrome d ubiquinol oxidase subunit I
LGLFAPLLANTAGWTFTEAGRQPWAVQGLLKTADGVSPMSTGTILFSLIVLTLLYAGLAVIELWLFLRVAKRGPDPAPKPISGPGGDAYLPSLAY